MAGFSWLDLHRDAILRGLQDFRTCDSDMLSRRLNERSITHRLAEDYRAHFDEANDQARNKPRYYSIDCEYNRVGYKVKPKRIPLDHDIPLADGGSYYTPCPDIILHHRGDDAANLLVNEIKLFFNNDPFAVLLDKVKLAAYVHEPLFYNTGLYLDLGLEHEQLVVSEAKLLTTIRGRLTSDQETMWVKAMSILTVFEEGRCKLNKVTDEGSAEAKELMAGFEDAFGFKDVRNQFVL